MLHAVVTSLVAQRQKKMIFKIMPRPEQSASLRHELAVRSLVSRRHRQCRLTLADHVDDVYRHFSRLRQLDLAVMFSRDQRRIDQRRDADLARGLV